ncbi:MAG: PAS domain S-box protein, partial [Ignavibacteria bacterium]|nr:PAS domain S-box protein [Ignavibacteria bacterium]
EEITMLAHALKSINECVSITDMEDKIIFVNHSFLETYGFREDELIGKYMTLVRSPNNPPELVGEILPATLLGGWHGELWNKSKDGSEFLIYLSTTLIKDKDGKSIGLIGVAIDITERKQAEEAIIERENFLNTLLDAIPIPVFYKDNAGRYLGFNKAYETFFGASRNEIIGKTVFEISPPELAEIYNAKDIELLENRVIQRYEFQIKTKHDLIRNVIFNKAVFTDNSGKVNGLIGAILDITERKQAEEALQDSREDLHRILNSMAEGAYGVDINGNCTFVNQAFLKMLGYQNEYEVFGKHIHELIHHSHSDGSPYPSSECRMYRSFLTNQPISVSDEVFWRKDGVAIPVEYWSLPIVKKGVVIGSIATFIDITERKRAEETLRVLSYRNEAILDSVPDIIMEVDNDKVYTWANNEGKEFFGDDVIGKKADFYFEGEQDTYSTVKPVFNGNENVIYVESMQRRKDGEKRTLAWWCKALKDENGNVTGALSSAQDITDSKKIFQELIVAKEKAEQSDKLKSEFLAQMSHEIRTPINVMLGNVDYLQGLFDENMDADTRDSFNGIDLASKRIIRTVDLILNTAELQTSGYKPDLQKVNLDSEILNKLYYEHQLSAKQKGLELIYKNDIKKSEIMADEYSITQIFANLIDNAIKFTKKGKVEILLEKNKTGNIMVEIKDTGIGMSKEYLPKLFKAFVQEEHGYSRSFDGNGLGLALLKNYCEINNAA